MRKSLEMEFQALERRAYECLASDATVLHLPWRLYSDPEIADAIQALVVNNGRCGEIEGEIPNYCLLVDEHDGGHAFEFLKVETGGLCL